jgi:hypothetical protein
VCRKPVTFNWFPGLINLMSPSVMSAGVGSLAEFWTFGLVRLHNSRQCNASWGAMIVLFLPQNFFFDRKPWIGESEPEVWIIKLQLPSGESQGWTTTENPKLTVIKYSALCISGMEHRRGPCSMPDKHMTEHIARQWLKKTHSKWLNTTMMEKDRRQIIGHDNDLIKRIHDK